jgi:hypothetical protein
VPSTQSSSNRSLGRKVRGSTATDELPPHGSTARAYGRLRNEGRRGLELSNRSLMLLQNRLDWSSFEGQMDKVSVDGDVR